MTKREIIKWLEVKEREAEQNAQQQYEEALRWYKERLYQRIKLKEVSDEIKGHLMDAHKIYQDWKASNAKGVENKGYYSGSVGAHLEYLLNGNGGIYGAMTRNDVEDQSPEKQRIHAAYRELAEEIKGNYFNLIENVKSLKNAKVACEYLEGLGFDLSELKLSDGCTALAVDIDTAYLFIKPVREESE